MFSTVDVLDSQFFSHSMFQAVDVFASRCFRVKSRCFCSRCFRNRCFRARSFGATRKERHRERNREIDKEKDRKTYWNTEREAQRKRQRDRQKDIPEYREIGTDEQTDRQTEIHIRSKIDRHRERDRLIYGENRETQSDQKKNRQSMTWRKSSWKLEVMDITLPSQLEQQFCSIDI